jgi:D-alanine-D-alanine ligase
MAAFGEDGTVASILELLGIPYTGSSFDASRLAFDKLAAKSVLRRAGLAVPFAIPLTEGALRELGVGALLDRAMDELGLPLVVKPNRGGSALGIRLVERPDQLPAALMAAFGYDDTVLLEQRVAGTELAARGGRRPRPRCPAVEIRPKEGWYDFSARYTHGAAEFRSPPTSTQSPPTTAARQRTPPTSPSAAATSPGSTPSSTPRRLPHPRGQYRPRLTSTSLRPMAADAAGLTFADLAAHLTDRATARRPR